MISEKPAVKVYDKPEDYVPENMEALVLKLVENGIKAVELMSRLTTANHETICIRCNPVRAGLLNCTSYEVSVLRYASVDPAQLIARMLAQFKIVELEYILPSMDYRIKSMYFPAGTKFKRSDDLAWGE